MSKVKRRKMRLRDIDLIKEKTQNDVLICGMVTPVSSKYAEFRETYFPKEGVLMYKGSLNDFENYNKEVKKFLYAIRKAIKERKEQLYVE